MKFPKQMGRKANRTKTPFKQERKTFLIKIRPQAAAEYFSDTSPKS